MADEKKGVRDEDPLTAGSTPLSAVPAADDKPPEAMTSEQATILRELCRQTGEEFDASLTRQQADERIDWLKAKAEGG